MCRQKIVCPFQYGKFQTLRVKVHCIRSRNKFQNMNLKGFASNARHPRRDFLTITMETDTTDSQVEFRITRRRQSYTGHIHNEDLCGAE